VKKNNSDFPGAAPGSDFGIGSNTNIADTNKPFWTLLQGNGTISKRLTRALGLKDPPGHPVRAKMSEVQVYADMMQGGYSAYKLENGANGFFGGVPAGIKYLAGSIIGPTDELDPALINLLGVSGSYYVPVSCRKPFIKNLGKDIRINNAEFVFFPHVSEFNPPADTKPMSLHCQFILNGSSVFTMTQNNLVSSSGDREFHFQITDSYWNGIVPDGAYLSWVFGRVDGLNGQEKVFHGGEVGIVTASVLSVPAGTTLPGK
jgi:hypothetical protein